MASEDEQAGSIQCLGTLTRTYFGLLIVAFLFMEKRLNLVNKHNYVEQTSVSAKTGQLKVLLTRVHISIPLQFLGKFGSVMPSLLCFVSVQNSNKNLVWVLQIFLCVRANLLQTQAGVFTPQISL